MIKYQLLPLLLLMLPIVYISHSEGDVYHLGKKFISEETYPHGFCFNGVTGNCVFGDTDKVVSVALFGDSHAAALSPFFNELAITNHFNIHITSASSCAPFMYSSKDSNDKRLNNFTQNIYCRRQMQDLTNNIGKYKVVILAGYWSKYITENNGVANGVNFVYEFRNTLKFLQQHHTRVIVVGDVPRYLDGGPIEQILRRKRLHAIWGGIPELNVSPKSILDDSNSEMSELSKMYPNVYFFDVQNEITSKIKKFPFLHDRLLYVDSNHLNVNGAIMLANYFKRSHFYNMLIQNICGPHVNKGIR